MTQAVQARTKPLPAKVENLHVTGIKDRIFVQWAMNSEPDVRYYLIYRKTGNGSWSTLKKLDGNQTIYEDLNIEKGKTYRYKVIVEDADGLKSDPQTFRKKSPSKFSKKKSTSILS